ncbi:hypothetical protein [Streptomyces sp. NBC_01185]|nr:hypothetical protein OG770_08800 [Streptomyces sp. NBC_01185]
MRRFSTDTEGVRRRLRDGTAGGVCSFPRVPAPQLDTGPGLVGAPRRRTA